MLRELWDLIHPTKESASYTTGTTQQEAIDAKQNSVRDYQEARDRAPRVDEVTSALYDQKERNHFAEMITASMKGAG